jgi:putative ubiquitin-RnfH superfamily antitoxin RatB of RatAB toxin-antitoxin module
VKREIVKGESSSGPGRLKIEVVYALRDEQALITLEVEEGTTAEQAVERSGILARYPGLDLGRGRIGIFGKPVEPGTVLQEGDRVEIYRPLTADPKEARRARQRSRRGGSQET